MLCLRAAENIAVEAKGIRASNAQTQLGLYLWENRIIDGSMWNFVFVSWARAFARGRPTNTSSGGDRDGGTRGGMAACWPHVSSVLCVLVLLYVANRKKLTVPGTGTSTVHHIIQFRTDTVVLLIQ